jgi:hypothetical protein
MRLEVLVPDGGGAIVEGGDFYGREMGGREHSSGEAMVEQARRKQSPEFRVPGSEFRG